MPIQFGDFTDDTDDITTDERLKPHEYSYRPDFRRKGTLTRWFHEDHGAGSGYGWILPDNCPDYGPAIFVHVSEFRRLNIRTPTLGMRLHYQLEWDSRGRLRAKNLSLPDESNDD